MNTCFYCKNSFEIEDTRPYGPEGAIVCFPCIMEDPDREALAAATFLKLLDAVQASGAVAVIGAPGGPATIRDAMAQIAESQNHV